VPNDLAKIRILNGSQDEAFEELCCQLAEFEPVPKGSIFTRKAPPDAGVECFWKLPTGDEYGWQAKYFLDPPGPIQWQQIDKSIKTVLEKHPRIISYTVCLPINRSDPRNEKQKSFLAKWNKNVEKWQVWAKDKKMSVEFKYWGSHEIWDRLSSEKHRGRSLFWLDSELFSQKWLEDQLDIAIIYAGPRYTPEVNVELPIAQLFEGLGHTTEFLKRIKLLYGKIKRGYAHAPTSMALEPIKEELKHLPSTMEPLLKYLQSLKESDVSIIDWDFIKKLSSESTILTGACVKKITTIKMASNSEQSYNNPFEPLETARLFLRDLSGDLTKLESFADNKEAHLSNVPAFLLVGNAGTGKSHLFCDIANQRIRRNLPTILLLGTQFRNAEPWSQIIQRLGLSCTRDQFLGALDSAAKARKSRALILIDGINEGDGKFLWKDNLPGMLKTLSKYPWIGIAISVRTSYEEVVIRNDLIPNNKLIREIHYGFSEHEYDATKIFFNYFGIVQPSIPNLLPEFQNPLFLKLFCQGLKNNGYTKIPSGMQGITFVFSFFVESVNKKLSEAEHLDFDSKSKPVQKAIDGLAELLATSNQPWIPREKAQNVVDAVLPRAGYEKSLFKNMISEGILTEDRFRVKDDEWLDGIHFSYERFTDHIIASHLLEKNLNQNDLIASFAVDKPLGALIKDERSCLVNRGLVEAFSIQLPERVRKELFEVAPYCANYTSVKPSFIESLIWRNPVCITDATKDCINKYIINDGEFFNKFLDALITVACNPEHPYNADFLNRQLIKYSIAERDAWWSIFLHYQYGAHDAVDRIVDWAGNSDNKSHINDKSIRLCGIALAWFLTTSNRFLRDKATKALVSIMENRIFVLKDVLDQFLDVNDPYVIERLFAVAYGCAMRSNDTEALSALAMDVYNKVFESGEPQPDILLRDYARGIIELASRSNSELKVDVKKIRPPYKSVWPSFEVPAAEELKKYGKYEKDMPDVEWSRVHLYQSIMGFEDFARYIIGAESGSGSFEWSSRSLKDANTPTLKQTYDNFVKSLTKKQKKAWEKYSLMVNVLESYKKGTILQLNISSETTAIKFTEQEVRELLIVCEHDLQKSLGKNKTKTLKEKIIPYLNHPNRDEFKFDLSIAQRWILKKVLDLGWTIELFGQFDRALQYHSRSGRSAHKAERIGKKYQWIAYHEFLARISDNFEYRGKWSNDLKKYEGAWQMRLRDIDPSFLLRKTQSEAWQTNTVTWWFPSEYTSWTIKSDDLDWLKTSGDIPAIQPLIQVTNPNDGSRWLVLDGNYTWQQPTPPEEKDDYNIPRRDMHYVLQSLIVKTTDIDKLLEWFKAQNVFYLPIPKARDLHATFLGELFYAPAYNYQLMPENGYEEWTRGDKSLLPAEVVVPSERYFWEYDDYDCSIDEVISIHTPSKWLYDFLKLEWSGIEGEYNDAEGKLMAFDPSVKSAGPAVLLLNEAALTKLQQSGYDILWVIAGEKMMIGGNMSPEDWKGRLEIEGVCRKNCVNIEGFLRSNFKK
jgi:hypothetical protein